MDSIITNKKSSSAVAKPLTKTQLAKQLHAMTRDDIEGLVISIYLSSKGAKDTINCFLNPNYRETLFEKYTKKLEKAVYSDNFNLTACRGILNSFVDLLPSPDASVLPEKLTSEDLAADERLGLLELPQCKIERDKADIIIRARLQFCYDLTTLSSNYGDFGSRFYDVLFSEYEKAAKTTLEFYLYENEKDRFQDCIKFAGNIGYGVEYDMETVFYDLESDYEDWLEGEY